MSKMAFLNELAQQYIMVGKDASLSERRRNHRQSSLMFSMTEILKPVARKIATRKNMLSNEDDMQQHTMIAILKAIESWDVAIASFSTHVHYHIQWELGSFEHYAFPERRRIKVKQPIRFVELDKPIKTADSDGGSTMVDFMVDENAESAIEENVERNRTLDYLERVMGAYIEIRWKAMRKLESGRLTIEKDVHNLCRDIDIYLQTRINGITHASLSILYGVTRERVRQIIGNVELAVKDYLPTKDADGENYNPPAVIYTGPQTEKWDILASWYWHASEREIRHTEKKPIIAYEDVLHLLPPIITTECRKIKTDAMVIEREAALETKPKKIKIEIPEIPPQMAEIVCINEAREAQTKRQDSKKPRVTQQLSMPFMAMAAMVSVNASAQTSRAIPPVEETHISTMREAPQKEIALRKGSAAGTGYGRQWAVKLDSYLNQSQLEAAAEIYLRNYPPLKNAKRASVKDPNGKAWLSYGPYELPQAKNVCLKIIADNKRCTVVRLTI